jgi:2-keto-4-pentenoate hydratase
MSVERGTEAMLTRRREILAQGAEPIGWKVGINDPGVQRKLGIDGPLAGFLTTDSLVEDSWDDYPIVVECEVAVELGPDARSIAALFPAIELADPPDLEIEVEQMIAGNIFHRAVAFGPRVEADAPGAGRILVDGEVQHELDSDQTGANLGMIGALAGRLEAAGEELRPGDRVITGILAPPHTAEPGDTVRFELDGVGNVEVRFS